MPTPSRQPDPALATLADQGVSAWLDDISRTRLSSGGLADLRDRGVVGVTTNPTIFQKALAGSDAYAEQISDLALRGVDLQEAVRSLTAYDVRWACDVLRPVYDSSGGVDGRVSIEVDPGLAHDTAATIAEARALWWLVDRPNLLIKIPATLEGLPAITACLAQGISVNVTLIFSVQRYELVMDAFLAGMEAARLAGYDLSKMASVASFFVSRVDTEVDRRLDALEDDRAAALRGRAAIANARVAYSRFLAMRASERWQQLQAAGATVQRPLWASTGVKDPAYDDTRYVVDLVAPETVNTMPEATLDAVIDHAEFQGDAITPNLEEGSRTLQELAEVGVDYDDVVETLERQGVAAFKDSWADMLSDLQASLDAAAT